MEDDSWAITESGGFDAFDHGYEDQIYFPWEPTTTTTNTTTTTTTTTAIPKGEILTEFFFYR